jgi:hypothetical protein
MSLALAIGRGEDWVVWAFVSMEIEIDRERERG